MLKDLPLPIHIQADTKEEAIHKCMKNIKDENNEIDKILEDNGGRFMRKPVDNDELVRRVKSEIPWSKKLS